MRLLYGNYPEVLLIKNNVEKAMYLKVYGLLLSAGFSSRLNFYKPLIKYKDKSFIVEILTKMLFVCENVFVVVGFKSDEVKKEVFSNFKTEMNRIKFIQNPVYESGMLSSLKCGLNAILDCNWILYHFIDQPFLSIEFYEKFINQADNNYEWIQPAFNSTKGHPILLNYSIKNKIIFSTENESLKEISSNFRKKFWQCNYPEVLKDIDTINDYKTLI